MGVVGIVTPAAGYWAKPTVVAHRYFDNSIAVTPVQAR